MPTESQEASRDKTTKIQHLVEVAAVCIQKAVDGKTLSGSNELRYPFPHRLQLHAFRTRHKYNLLFRLAAWGMIFITIFERPSWSYQDTYCSSWRNNEKFPSFSIGYFYIEEATASYLSMTFLLVLLFAIVLELTYRSSEYLHLHFDDAPTDLKINAFSNENATSDSECKSPIHTNTSANSMSTMMSLTLGGHDLNKPLTHQGIRETNPLSDQPSQVSSQQRGKQRRSLSIKMLRLPHWPVTCITICWLLKVIETLTFFISSKQKEAALGSGKYCDSKTLFSASPVEAFFLIFIEKSYSTFLMHLSRNVPRFVGLVCVLTVVILIFTALGEMLFNPESPEGHKYFEDYSEATWTMFTVLVKANWPNPIIPAYNTNRLYGIYFLVYIVVGNWCILNAATGLQLDLYKSLTTITKEKIRDRRRMLIQSAFYTLHEASTMVDTVNVHHPSNTRENKKRIPFFILQALFREFSKNYRLNILTSCFREHKQHSSKQWNSSNFLTISEDVFMDFIRTVCTGEADVDEKDFNRFMDVMKDYDHDDISDNFDDGEHEYVNEFDHDSNNSTSKSSQSNDVAEAVKEAFPVAITPDQGQTSRLTLQPSDFGLFEPSPVKVHIEAEKSRARTASQSSHQVSFRWRIEEDMRWDWSTVWRSLTADHATDGGYYLLANFTFDFLFCLLSTLYVYVDYSSTRPTICVNIIFALEAIQLYFAAIYHTKDLATYYYLFTHVLIVSLYIAVASTTTAFSGAFFMASCMLRYVTAVRSVKYFCELLIACSVLLLDVMSPHPHQFIDNKKKIYKNLELFSRVLNVPRLLLSTSAMLEFLFLILFLFNFMFCYSAAGVNLFGGVIEKNLETTQNTTSVSTNTTYNALDTSQYAVNEYWPVNFNDMLSGLVTTFLLLLVNNMHIIEGGFDSALTSQTQSFFCKMFFLSFYILAVLFLLNIVTSFIVNQVDSVLKQDEEFSISVSRSRTIQEISEEHELINQFTDEDNDKDDNSEADDNQEDEDVIDEAIIRKTQAAMIFLHYAKYGVYKSTTDIAIITATKFSVDSFIKRVRIEFVLQLSSYTMLLIGIFHRQLWTYDASLSPNLSSSWYQSTVYVNSRVRSLNPIASGAIVFFLESILMYGILLEVGYKINWRKSVVRQRTWKVFVLDFLGLNKESYSGFSLRLMYVVILAMNMIIVLSGFLSLAADHSKSEGHTSEDTNYIFTAGAVISCWISVVSIFLFDRQAASILKLISSVAPRFITLLILLLAYVSLFGYIGYSFFFPGQMHKSSDGATDEGPLDNKQYFGSLNDSMWTVFVMLTSSSVPSQLIPSYTKSRLAIFYFLWFIIPGTFVLLNIIFAFVIVEYAKASKAFNDKVMRSRISCLHNAFDCINEDKEQGLQYSQVYSLLRVYFDTMNKYFISSTKITDTKVLIMVASLDVDNEGVIDFKKFACLLTILQAHIILETRKSTYLPEFITYSPAFISLKKFVESGNFTFLIDTLVVVLIVVGLVANDSVYFFSETELLIIFISSILSFIGLVLKLICLGVKRYLKKSSHIFEMVLTTSFLVFSAAYLFEYEILHGVTKILMIIKMVHYCRHVRYFTQPTIWANITHEVKIIITSLKYILIVFFLAMYTFTLIGIAQYGGRVSHDPQNIYFSDLTVSAYAENQFFPLNFNDMLSGLYTLFCCLHVSDFDVIAAGMVSVSSKASGRMYFAIWHIIGDQLLLSIVRSVLLNSILNRKWSKITSNTDECDDKAKELNIMNSHSKKGSNTSHPAEGATTNLSSQRSFLYSDKEKQHFLSKDTDETSVYREFHVSVNIVSHIIDNHAPELSKRLMDPSVIEKHGNFNEGDHNYYKTYLTTVPLVDPIGDQSTNLSTVEKMNIIKRLQSMSVDDIDTMTSSGPQLSFS